MPAPPLAPALNCRPALPVTLEFIVNAFPLVAPRVVVAEVLLVMVPLMTTPVAVALKPAKLPELYEPLMVTGTGTDDDDIILRLRFAFGEDGHGECEVRGL